eukprot:CAMPEP_0177202056 /NCGR_PEP_ID=MMETSP0367-20130122/27089_1 /TAXON_ID=447022 ORGANISM="Scrippsiella hangoei-like, Strain SHHI-4" /NCGR_SAMPLE_ID=MMETSP0367 /ASSEMBLY_ACC=CAM_ASM_000362 /LENGTH=44 /DNA_ID= /DNA_START= /DNA_END= /DNA_ORIENTATION=
MPQQTDMSLQCHVCALLKLFQMSLFDLPICKLTRLQDGKRNNLA